MRKIIYIAAIIGAIFLTTFAIANATTILDSYQGGTGFGYPGNVYPGAILFGNYGNATLATSSGLTYASSTQTLSATYASTTAISGTSVCIGSTCKTSWPSSSSGLSTTSPLSAGNLLVYTTSSGGQAYGISTTTTGTASDVLSLDANGHTTIPLASTTALSVTSTTTYAAQYGVKNDFWGAGGDWQIGVEEYSGDNFMEFGVNGVNDGFTFGYGTPGDLTEREMTLTSSGLAVAYASTTAISATSLFATNTNSTYASTTQVSASTGYCIGSSCITSWATSASSTLLSDNNTWTGHNYYDAENYMETNETFQFGNSGSNGGQLYYDGSNFNINTTSLQQPLLIDASKVEIATNNSGEDTGVGATSPNAKLEVLGNSGSNILRLDYSTSDYANFNVLSTGTLVLTTTNSTPFDITNGIFSEASSTIGGGTQATGLTINGGATTTGALVLQGSTTTSANGINLSAGCFALNGTCLSSGGSGTVTSVGLSTPNSTLTLGGTNPVTTSGTITADLNLANSNWWTAVQDFTNATTSGLEATSTNIFFDGYTSALLEVNGSHQLTAYAGATSCTNQFFTGFSALGASTCGSVNNADWSGTQLSVGNGGTGETSQSSNGIAYYNGTGITTNSSYTLTSSLLTAPNASTTNVTVATYLGISGSITASETLPATSTSMTLNWASTGPQLDYQIGTAATTITLINATTSLQDGSRKLVWICNPNGTAGTLTWAGVQWIGTAPTQTTTANECDVYSFDVTYGTSTSAFKVAGTQGAGFQ